MQKFGLIGVRLIYGFNCENNFMKRRSLLKVCLFLAGITSSASLQKFIHLKHDALQYTRGGLNQEQLTGLFYHLDSARAIGRQYLASFSDFDRDAFLSTLSLEFQKHRMSTSSQDLDSLKKFLRQRQQQDFAEGRIVKLHGWVLSTTEAQLYAFIVLA